jgi:hypothetical protein
MINTELSDYWMHFVSEDYGRNSVHIAPRFYDLAPERWLELTSIYYSRFGMKQPPLDDRYIGKLPGTDRDIVRSHRVDAIVLENPVMDDMAKFFYDSWIAKKAVLEKRRKAEPPPVVIAKPNPLPPNPPMPPLPKDDDVYAPHPNMPKKPKPSVPTKPIDLPTKQEEPAAKKNPPAWVVRSKVWWGILAGAAGLVAWFFPAIKVWLLAIVPIVEAIFKFWGV